MKLNYKYYIQLDCHYKTDNCQTLFLPTPHGINTALGEYYDVLTDFVEHLKQDVLQDIPNTKYDKAPELNCLVVKEDPLGTHSECTCIANYHWYNVEAYPAHLMDIMIASMREIQQTVARDPLLALLL